MNRRVEDAANPRIGASYAVAVAVADAVADHRLNGANVIAVVCSAGAVSRPAVRSRDFVSQETGLQHLGARLVASVVVDVECYVFVVHD